MTTNQKKAWVLLTKLKPGEKNFKAKLALLHNIIQFPRDGTIIGNHIVRWAADNGILTRHHMDSGTSWFSYYGFKRNKPSKTKKK